MRSENWGDASVGANYPDDLIDDACHDGGDVA